MNKTKFLLGSFASAALVAGIAFPSAIIATKKGTTVNEVKTKKVIEVEISKPEVEETKVKAIEISKTEVKEINVSKPVVKEVVKKEVVKPEVKKESIVKIDQTTKTITNLNSGDVLLALYHQLKDNIEMIIAMQKKAIDAGMNKDPEVPSVKGIDYIKVDYNKFTEDEADLANLTDVYFNLSSNNRETVLFNLYSKEIQVYFEIKLNGKTNYDAIYQVLKQELDKIMSSKAKFDKIQDVDKKVKEYKGSQDTADQFFIQLATERAKWEMANGSLTSANESYKPFVENMLKFTEEFNQSQSFIHIIVGQEAWLNDYIIKFWIYDNRVLKFFQPDGKLDIKKTSLKYTWYNYRESKIVSREYAYGQGFNKYHNPSHVDKNEQGEPVTEVWNQ